LGATNNTSKHIEKMWKVGNKQENNNAWGTIKNKLTTK
jgi:hypothetical protein